jgi:organic anion transporter 3A
MRYLVFEEKPHHHLGDGDATLPSSEIATPSSISSPTEPTKSTNLEETGSSNQTQDSTEVTNRSKNMEVEVPDTRQAPLALEEPDVEIKPLTSMTENRNHDV